MRCVTLAVLLMATPMVMAAKPARAMCAGPALCLSQGYEFKAATSVRLFVGGKQQVIDRLFFVRDKELVACDQLIWPDGPPPKFTDPPGLYYCKVK